MGGCHSCGKIGPVHFLHQNQWVDNRQCSSVCLIRNFRDCPAADVLCLKSENVMRLSLPSRKAIVAQLERERAALGRRNSLVPTNCRPSRGEPLRFGGALMGIGHSYRRGVAVRIFAPLTDCLWRGENEQEKENKVSRCLPLRGAARVSDPLVSFASFKFVHLARSICFSCECIWFRAQPKRNHRGLQTLRELLLKINVHSQIGPKADTVRRSRTKKTSIAPAKSGAAGIPPPKRHQRTKQVQIPKKARSRLHALGPLQRRERRTLEKEECGCGGTDTDPWARPEWSVFWVCASDGNPNWEWSSEPDGRRAPCPGEARARLQRTLGKQVLDM